MKFRAHVRVRLGKWMTRALVDTGAHASFIHRRFFEKVRSENFPVRRDRNTKKLIGMAGSVEEQFQGIRAPLRIGDAVYEQDLRILSSIPYPVILGTDFLKRYRCTVDCGKETLNFPGKPKLRMEYSTKLIREWKGDTFVMSNGTQERWVQFSGRDNPEGVLYSMYGLTIPRFSQRLIDVMFFDVQDRQGVNHGMVDSYIMRMKDGIVIGKGVVPFENGRGRILCCNVSGADAHYPEGTPMAKMEWVNLEELEMVSVDTDASQEQSPFNDGCGRFVEPGHAG